MEKLSILVLDDEERVRDEIGEFLDDSNYRVHKAAAPGEAFNILEKNDIDIGIVDIKLPEMDGLTFLKKVKESHPEIEIIMISGHGDMKSVIEAMRWGAIDFFPKPFRLLDINTAIQRTTRFIELSNKYREIKHNYELLTGELKQQIGHTLIGNSAGMKNIINLMAKLAKTRDTSVLITGESGTGKELVARGIHYLSDRKGEYFHSVNCSAIPETLFESEFFGHKKGSFTGATENRAGWFETANKGTLFLDEISDMPLGQQAKLLRILEEKKVSRVGSQKEIPVDVRVVAASNQDIEKMSADRKFRLDLYHRLSSFIIHIPPLRERKEDIPKLIRHFVKFYSAKLNKPIVKTEKRVFDELIHYHFPGNVRELRNMIERAMILCESDILSLKDFQVIKSSFTESSQQTGPVAPTTETYDLEQAEKNLIVKALEKAGSNKSKAAELLNISWQSLDRRLKKYKIE